MLTGEQLGEAIATAIRLKGVKVADVARHFGVKPPSVIDWKKRGTVGKEKLDALFEYFSDVVGPSHWGRSEHADKNWPKDSKTQSATPHHTRELVQKVCDLAERLDDQGLLKLQGYASCLLSDHELPKEKAA